MSTEAPPVPQKINLRRPDIMAAVQAQVLSHYRSDLVERIRANGHILSAGDLTIKLAKEFGFCYGVERAIDLAYAARKVFPDQPIYILGEIIHNPEVNEQLIAMGVKFLTGAMKSLFAVAENYPELKASEEFTQLQGSLSQTEETIQNARRYYNAVVRDLNTKIQSFPTNILAGMFGFQQRQFFETAATDREPVAVKF